MMAPAIFALVAALLSVFVYGVTQPQSNVYQSVSSKVSALEARLQEIEFENKQILTKRKEQYETKLKAQQKENLALAVTNSHVAAELEAIDKKNGEFRQRASELETENALWLRDLNLMQRNLTTALEFTNTTLRLDVHPRELDVLSELQHQDKMQGATMERRKRLDEVAKATEQADSDMALLQMTSGTAAGPSPKDLLKVLDSSLNELASNQDDQVSVLRNKFMQLYQQGSDTHQRLLVEQRKLNETRVSFLELGTRLRSAVEFLEDRHSHLEERAHAVRNYAQRLGIIPVPKLASSMQVPRMASTAASTVVADNDADEDEEDEDDQDHSGQMADDVVGGAAGGVARGSAPAGLHSQIESLKKHTVGRPLLDFDHHSQSSAARPESWARQSKTSRLVDLDFSNAAGDEVQPFNRRGSSAASHTKHPTTHLMQSGPNRTISHRKSTAPKPRRAGQSTPQGSHKREAQRDDRHLEASVKGAWHDKVLSWLTR